MQTVVLERASHVEGDVVFVFSFFPLVQLVIRAPFSDENIILSWNGLQVEENEQTNMPVVNYAK
jgi:hypothetical protein